MKRFWVAGLLPLLLAADFWNPRIEGYRVWVGPHEPTDWIDVCCQWTDQGKLLWADYSPIEKIELMRTVNNQAIVTIYKKHSLWHLTVLMGNPNSAVLHLMNPRGEGHAR